MGIFDFGASESESTQGQKGQRRALNELGWSVKGGLEEESRYNPWNVSQYDMRGQTQPFLQGMMQLLSGIGGGFNPGQSFGFSDNAFRRAMGTASGIADWRGQADAQMASLKSGLGAMFRDEINPAIKGNALGAGGFGGGRQGVAQGVAAGQLADTYAASHGDIMASARQSGLQGAGLMGQLGGLWDTRQRFLGDQALAGRDQRLQAAQLAPAMAQAYQQNAYSPITAFWDTMMKAAQSVGPLGSEQKSSGVEFGF